MSDQFPEPLTHAQLTETPADQRAGLVEAYLLASIRAMLPQAGTVDASSRLADLAIDSLQIVELKFGLDQALGQEVDIELIIGNPSIGGLASESVRAAGL